MEQIQVDPNMRDYRNEPFFIAKAKKAKELLDQIGMPNALITGPDYESDTRNRSCKCEFESH